MSLYPGGRSFCALSIIATLSQSPSAAERPDVSGPVSTATMGARCIGAAFDDTPAFQRAIDTGRSVYAPALDGRCHIVKTLKMKTPGQIVFGDGRARTKIEIAPDFLGDGVFDAETGEPGPIWRDFSIRFLASDSAISANPRINPTAFLAKSVPRFEIRSVGCYRASVCVDMTGNSGGARIEDFQYSSLYVGIKIDGSLDNVRMDNLNWWPFEMSESLSSFFYGIDGHCPAGISAARVDGLIISNSIFSGCRGVDIYQSAAGFATGSLSNVDFDNNSGFRMTSGAFSITGGSFAVGNINAQAIVAESGSLMISGTSFLIAAPLRNPLIETAAIVFAMSSSTFAMGSQNATAIRQTGGVMMLSNTSFMRDPNVSYTSPTIDLPRGRAMIEGCYASDKGKGDGVFLSVANDNPFNRIVGNSSPGWRSLLPKTLSGVYYAN